MKDAQVRGQREAEKLLGLGPLEFAVGRLTGTRGEARVTRGKGLGHGGLVRWVEDELGGRWPVLTESAVDRSGAARYLRGGPRCPVRRVGAVGQPWCHNPAGWGTDHPGVGRCRSHGGRWPRGKAEAGWIMSHAFAGELDCSPWEALLKAVRIAAKRVAYTDWVLGQAADDLELEGRFGRDESGLLVHPDTGEPLGGGQLRDRSWWVTKNELWVDRLARYGKLAIDAGVAERLVHQVEIEAQQIGRVLGAALGELEGQVSEEILAQVRGAMRRELLQIEAEQVGLTPSRDADSRVVDSTYVGDEEK